MGVDIYFLKNKSNRRIAAVLKGSTALNAPAGLSTRNDSPGQRWVLEPVSNGYYRIINRNSNMAMANGGRTENGAAIIQVAKAAGDSQLWRLEDVGTGHKRIINKLSGKALCIHGEYIRNEGAALIQWDYFGAAHLKWYLLPASTDYTYSVYLETYKNKTITLKAGDISRSDIENVELLPALAGVPLRPDTQDKALQSVVLVGTAFCVALSIIAAPGVLAIVGGIASLATNSAWLYWPTDSEAQWAVLDQVYQRTSSLLCAELAAKLEGTRKSFENRAATIRTALEKSAAGTVTALELATATEYLDNLDVELTSLGTFLTFINDPAAHPEIWNKYDGDKTHPEVLVRFFLPYLMMHTRVLLAFCMLSDEYNGRGTAMEVHREATLVESFLDSSRKALVKTLRSRQEKAVAGYTTKEDVFIPAHSIIRTSRGFYVECYGAEVSPRMRYGTEALANGAIASFQKANAEATYAKDEALRLLFNSIQKAFTNLGLDLPTTVAPISEKETRWGQYA